MNRHRAYFPLDDAPVSDGDGKWVGVNSLIDPASLPDGYAAGGVNLRFENGKAGTRGGIRIMPWGGLEGADIGKVTPYGDLLIGETFSDPINGREWLVLVTDSGTYKARSGTPGTTLAAASGISFGSVVDLVQTYNGMVALRGAALEPVYMDDLDVGWKALPDAQAGKEKAPPSTQGLYLGNRLLLVDARPGARYVDSVWVSDIGATSSVLQGSSAYQSFKINQGTSDRLIALAAFNDSTVICAKTSSVWAVSGVSGTNDELAQNARLDPVTKEYGCRSPRSFVQVGNDLWFMGHRRGVCSIAQTATNKLQGVDIPVSRSIQSLIDRINWFAAGKVVAASGRNYVYFAVPLDGASDNNAILVYSLINREWCGYDMSAATRVRDFVEFTYGGARRLGFLSIDGFVCLLEDGAYDHVGDEDGNLSYLDIETELLSRGYGGRVSGTKRFTRLEWHLSGWNPSYSISVVPEGVSESRLVKTITPDATQYDRPHGTPDWDPTNVDGDWDTRYRQDYAVDPGVSGGLSVTDANGNGTVAFDVLQQSDDGIRLREAGRSVQVKITNSRGRLEVSGLSLETIRGRTRDGRIV